MAIIVKTKMAQSLVSQLMGEIDNGLLDTWSYDEDGDFTHTGQWEEKGWFRPVIHEEDVTFIIMGRRGIPMSKMEYSIYHGRFVEALLNHVIIASIDGIEVTKPGQVEEKLSTVTISWL